MRKLFLTLLLACLAAPAFAQNAEPDPNYKMLDLYPNGRAAYLAKYEQQTEKYQAQGYDYIERLYDERAEGSAKSASAPPMPEAEVDSYIESLENPAPTNSPAQ